jgi:hypothetical protein
VVGLRCRRPEKAHGTKPVPWLPAARLISIRHRGQFVNCPYVPRCVGAVHEPPLRHLSAQLVTTANSPSELTVGP